MDSDTTIIGAGPYGLSIAAHLKAAGVPYHIFGSPLESWRRFMPAGMILKSEPFASNLWDPERRSTLERFCAEMGKPYQHVGRPVPLELFLTYADWFRERTVGHIQDEKVVRIARLKGGAFRIELAGGAVISSRRVVLATGHMDHRVVPPEVHGLPEPLVAHSSRIGDPASYAGRDVTIVGAGQSALETAALLHEVGAHVHVLVRRAHVEWNPPSIPRPLLQRIRAPDAGVASGWKSWAISELPGVFRRVFAAPKRHRFVAGSYGPSGAWWLRERVDGRIEIDTGTRLEAARIENGRVLIRIRRPAGIEERATDHLFAATGYKVDIDRVECLDASLKRMLAREAGGIPVLDSRFQSSVPGLYIVGFPSAPVFGPIMRFMYGAKHPARVLARHFKSSP